MKKRFILLLIITIYISSIAISPIISAESTSKIDLETEAEFEKPLNIGEQKEIEIQVKYKLNIGSIAKLFFGRRIIRTLLFGPSYFFKLFSGDPKVNVKLSVESPDPEWCMANVEPSKLEFTLKRDITEGKTKTITLTYILNETAPALVNESIIINANFNGIGSIKGASDTISIPIIPEYISDIVASADSEFTIPPLENYSFPVNVTNNGNGETNVSFEIEEPDNWNISLNCEEVIVPVNETKQMSITVKPPKGFNNSTIALTLKSKSTGEFEEDPSVLEGKTVSLSFTFYDDGSLIEDDKDEDITIDTTLLIIVLFVIIIIIVIIFIIKRIISKEE